jgi:transaldolase
MKIFLDTANVDEIREVAKLGIIDGVTTNPSLIAKEGKDFEKTIKEICSIIDGPISAEVVSTESKDMIKEGVELSKLHKNIVVKVPFTYDGLIATNELSNKGIDVNVTLIFSANQALLACKAGARYVSPFAGRLDDIGHDGIEVCEQCQDMIINYGYETEVIAASIRHSMHCIEAAQKGIDIATLPYKVIIQMMKHPLTDIGLANFLADWEKYKNK